MHVTAIVLAYNEQVHLQRCILNVQQFVNKVIVVDSFSTDSTTDIAIELGAEVLRNPWRNYATQFNWALENISHQTDWILRIDADEYFDEEFLANVRNYLEELSPDVAGIVVDRWMYFQGRSIRYGGLFPVKVVRLFRYGAGRCENRWMDEHIIVDGETDHIKGRLIDDNKNYLTWWTSKHNSYSSREAIELLNYEFNFIQIESIADYAVKNQAGTKRWIKERLYSRMPAGLRALVYFLYRYIFMLGFLDGSEGRRFHVLQGFWYRYLVDAKVDEVKKLMSRDNVGPKEAILTVLEIEL